jgi:hypothetical protein
MILQVSESAPNCKLLPQEAPNCKFFSHFLFVFKIILVFELSLFSSRKTSIKMTILSRWNPSCIASFVNIRFIFKVRMDHNHPYLFAESNRTDFLPNYFFYQSISLREFLFWKWHLLWYKLWFFSLRIVFLHAESKQCLRFSVRDFCTCPSIFVLLTCVVWI